MPSLFDRVRAFLDARGVESYLVGGSLRDELLGRQEVRDIDLAVAGSAAGLARAFANVQSGAFYLMDAEHDVARALVGDTYVDFAQLRGDLLADLGTRDFSINAMARRIDRLAGHASPVIDPFGGQEDLRQRRLRAVSESVFQNDPVRLLRAVRLAGELGLDLDGHTEALMRRDAGSLASASLERARDELFKILALPNAADHVRRMHALALLAPLLPEVAALEGVVQSEPHAHDVLEHTLLTLQALIDIQALDYSAVAATDLLPQVVAHFARPVAGGRARGTLLRFSALCHDLGKPASVTVDEQGRIHFYGHAVRGAAMVEPLMRRLRLSTDEIKIVSRTVEYHLRPADLARARQVTNRAIYRLFRDAGDSGVDVAVMAMADWRGKSRQAVEDVHDSQLQAVVSTLLDRYYRTREAVIAPPPLVDGRTVMRELRLLPGPHIGDLLEAVREAQVEGHVTTAEQALDWLRRNAGTRSGGRTRPLRSE